MLLADRRLPSGRAIVIGRISHEESRTRHRDEVSETQDCKSLGNSEPRDQMLGNRCGDKSARAKSGDGKPGDHAAFVRKPFDQGCHRYDVTETEADAAQHAIKKVEQPQVASNLSREHQAKAVAEAAGGSHAARPAPLHPQSAGEGSKPEHE